MDKQRLHICIVTADFPGLTETFITNKVLQLSQRGHRITVIKNIDSGNINQSHLALVEDAGIEILTMHNLSSLQDVVKAVAKQPNLFFGSFSASFKQFKSSYKSKLQLQLLTKHSYDIIHFEFSGLTVSYLQSLRKLKSKTVVSCRGTAEKVKPLTDFTRKQNLQTLFETVNAIHCVSEDMARTVEGLGAEAKKIFVNRPAIDTNLFSRSKSYYEPTDLISILSIGRFTFQKGYLIGLLALKELKATGTKFKWLIVGDGPLSEEMVYHVNALGLTEDVQLLGKKSRNQILDLYNKVDIFLLPSVYEGIANVCLEAMAMELPVVSTRSGGMEEVIVDGVNGLLCETYNPSDIVAKLQKITSNFSFRKELGIKARQTVVNNFTLENQLEIFEQQYHRLVNN